jgi:hypothetical protein|tara:strand:+ start:150 stop:404 length:255 start_codon:yes stop_codon:yes gene_type:complete
MPKELETVTARLNIEVFVDCPKCNICIDILNPEDTSDYDHNEEGRVLGQACGEGIWIDNHKQFKVKNVTCSACKAKFNVKGVEW